MDEEKVKKLRDNIEYFGALEYDREQMAAILEVKPEVIENPRYGRM